MDPVCKEWKQEYRNLSKRQIATQKQLTKLLPFNQTTDLKPKIDKMYDDWHISAKNLYDQQKEVMDRLSNVRKQVGQLRELLKFYERKNEYLLKVQKVSESVVSGMEAFKDQMSQKYEECAELQQNLAEQIEIMESKIDLYERGQEPLNQVPVRGKQNHTINTRQSEPTIVIMPNSPSDPLLSKISSLDNNLHSTNQQMEAIERQIAHLGRHYGWPQDDHNDFLFIWNRRRGNNYFELSAELQKHLRMYTQEQINAHIDKHRNFLQLQQQKKELLHQYKLLKEQKRDVELKLVEKKDQEQELKKQKERRQVDLEKEDKERKEKLLQWKLMKEAKKEAEELKTKEEEALKKEEMMRKRRQIEERKQIIEQWREQQSQRQEKQTQKTQPRRPQSAVNRQTIEKIKQREEEMVRKRMEVLKSKEEAERERIMKEEQLRQKKIIKYSHLGSKLQEKTAAIGGKQREKFDGKQPKEASTFGGVIGVQMSRAVPSWRQGI